ncbi:MAG: efflux RND transporter permease subunit [Ignavibacteriae bacterium]|nr:MAG: efflux RND transporter permease subunit [Ignavibacteriota bacterium]
MTITELSIKRPTLVVVVFTVIAVLGLFSYFQLNYELLPRMSVPVVVVQTVYPGASPYEVENNVSKVIEDAVSGIDKIDAVSSRSFESMSLVIIEFKQNADIDNVVQDASRKVNAIVAKLPTDAKAPVVSKIAFDEIPVLRMGVTSQMDSREFYQFLKDRVQPRISKIAGVAQVSLTGGEEREIKVNMDAGKVRAYGMSVLQVVQAVRSANMDFPTGKIKDEDAQFVVRIAGKFKTIDDLRDLVVGRSRQGGDIRLRDIAEVQDGIKEYEQMNRVNGLTSVGIQVVKQSDANAVSVSKLVRQELQTIQAEYKDQGIFFDIAQDTSTFTLDSANAVKKDLMLAIMMVAIVMLLFLHSIRNSLIVLVAIPSSLIATFVIMYALDFSMNLMTLLGLSLVIGILVDDSIVVLENIYHHIEKGEESRTAALRGRNEIGLAALSITMVDVVVFLPLSLVSGIVGQIMRQYALVVVGATLMSLFVSFTITPTLASRFAKLERLTDRTLLGRFALAFERFYHRFSDFYQKILKWSIDSKIWFSIHFGRIEWRFTNKFKVVLMVTALLIFSISLMFMGLIGNEFMPQSDRGEFGVSVELLPGSSVEQTNQTALQIERMLSQMPEVKKVFTGVGAQESGALTLSSNNLVQFNVSLTPKETRKKTTSQIGEEIKDRVREIPGAKVYVNPIGIFGSSDQSAIQIGISGTDNQLIMQAAERIKQVLSSVEGTTDVRLSSESGKPEMQVDIDRAKLAQLGLSVADVGTTLRVALTGDNDSKFRDGTNEYDIRIQFDQYNRSQTESIGSMTFMNNRGQLIELKQFANVSMSSGPTKLERRDRIGVVYVNGQTLGRPTGTIMQEFKNKIAGVQLPTGISLSYLGMEKMRGDSFIDLFLAMMIGILFVYLIMVALYDSYVYPFVVLFAIPLAMVGAMIALAVSGKSLSIFTILGIIMLIGLVTKNAILLVDRTNQTRLELGLSVYDALLEAAKSRLRPILMTTFTMIFGMAPIALSTAAGSEWKSGLAWAIIGGLTSSLFLTLIVVPVVYMKVDEWKTRIPAFFNKPSSMFKRPRNGKQVRRSKAA